MSVCQGCGTDLPPSRSNRPRKWCSGRCRKAQYAATCVDCGARLNGSAGRGPNAPIRCWTCNGVRQGGLNRVWTQQLILDRIREWARDHGEPPAQPDWGPSLARRLNDELRAQRFEQADGYWPWYTEVHREFGSWNTAIVAAGFEPRPAHGGGGNGARHRSVRERVAA